jgi:predicted O-methyltransferase YrrM
MMTAPIIPDAPFTRPRHEGTGYLKLLRRLHALQRPRTYLEIGTAAGRTLAIARCASIAIDPRFRLARDVLKRKPGGKPACHLFEMTSDAFFAAQNPTALFGRPIDLAFIDGLHHFEFALRDFMNVERCCAPGSTILIDDCFPHDRRTAQRKRFIRFWNGDVWKLLVLLKKHRPDLAIHTVAAPPAGLTIVRNLDPSSRFIADNLPRLVEEFMALDHSYLEKDRATKLNLFPNDWEKIETLLARQL